MERTQLKVQRACNADNIGSTSIVAAQPANQLVAHGRRVWSSQLIHDRWEAVQINQAPEEALLGCQQAFRAGKVDVLQQVADACRVSSRWTWEVALPGCSSSAHMIRHTQPASSQHT